MMGYQRGDGRSVTQVTDLPLFAASAEYERVEYSDRATAHFDAAFGLKFAEDSRDDLPRGADHRGDLLLGEVQRIVSVFGSMSEEQRRKPSIDVLKRETLG